MRFFRHSAPRVTARFQYFERCLQFPLSQRERAGVRENAWTNQVGTNSSNVSKRPTLSPSPFIPLPLGEGNRSERSSFFVHPSINAAFTLIEVVISASLMALVLVAAYVCLSAGFASKKMVEPRADIVQNARVAMNLMAADLRAACPIGNDYQFIGMRRLIGEMDADNVDFGTHNYTPKRPFEGDFCQASFYLDKDPETGQLSLWRRRNPLIAIDPLSGGSKEEIAKGIVGLRFEYSDGLDWYDDWGEIKPSKRDPADEPPANMVGMPEAVRITLSMDSNPKAKKSDDDESRPTEPPFVFQTVARLNLAGSSTRASSSAAANSTSPDASSQGGTQQQ